METTDPQGMESQGSVETQGSMGTQKNYRSHWNLRTKGTIRTQVMTEPSVSWLICKIKVNNCMTGRYSSMFLNQYGQ